MRYNEGSTNAALPIESVLLACKKALETVEGWRAKEKAKLIAKGRKNWAGRWFHKHETDEEFWKSDYFAWTRNSAESVGRYVEMTAGDISALALAALKAGQTTINVSAEDFSRLSRFWPES